MSRTGHAREITGVVNDQARAAVPGATITVTNIDTNRQRVVTSSGDGVYAAPTLAPGNYRIDVQLSGFKPVRREGIRLSTGEKARIDFDLVVGDVREQVTVTRMRRSFAQDRQSWDRRGARAGRAIAVERLYRPCDT